MPRLSIAPILNSHVEDNADGNRSMTTNNKKEKPASAASMHTLLLDLPDEVLYHIFSFIAVSQVTACPSSPTSSSFRTFDRLSRCSRRLHIISRRFLDEYRLHRAHISSSIATHGDVLRLLNRTHGQNRTPLPRCHQHNLRPRPRRPAPRRAENLIEEPDHVAMEQDAIEHEHRQQKQQALLKQVGTPCSESLCLVQNDNSCSAIVLTAFVLKSKSSTPTRAASQALSVLHRCVETLYIMPNCMHVHRDILHLAEQSRMPLLKMLAIHEHFSLRNDRIVARALVKLPRLTKLAVHAASLNTVQCLRHVCAPLEALCLTGVSARAMNGTDSALARYLQRSRHKLQLIKVCAIDEDQSNEEEDSYYGKNMNEFDIDQELQDRLYPFQGGRGGKIVRFKAAYDMNYSISNNKHNTQHQTQPCVRNATSGSYPTVKDIALHLLSQFAPHKICVGRTSFLADWLRLKTTDSSRCCDAKNDACVGLIFPSSSSAITFTSSTRAEEVAADRIRAHITTTVHDEQTILHNVILPSTPPLSESHDSGSTSAYVHGAAGVGGIGVADSGSIGSGNTSLVANMHCIVRCVDGMLRRDDNPCLIRDSLNVLSYDNDNDDYYGYCLQSGNLLRTRPPVKPLKRDVAFLVSVKSTGSIDTIDDTTGSRRITQEYILSILPFHTVFPYAMYAHRMDTAFGLSLLDLRGLCAMTVSLTALQDVVLASSPWMTSSARSRQTRLESSAVLGSDALPLSTTVLPNLKWADGILNLMSVISPTLRGLNIILFDHETDTSPSNGTKGNKACNNSNTHCHHDKAGSSSNNGTLHSGASTNDNDNRNKVLSSYASIATAEKRDMAVDALLRMIVHCKLLTTLSMSVHVLLVMADVNVRKQQQQQGMISMFDQMFSSVAHRLRRVHLHGGGDSDNSDGCDGIDMWQSEEQQQQRRMDFPVVGQSAHMRGRSLPRRRRTPKKRKGESPSECGVDNNQQNACDFVLETLCILPAFLGSLTSQVHSSRLANAAASRLIQEQAQKQRQQQQIYRRRYHQQQQQIQQRHRQHQQQQRQQQQKQQRQQQQQKQRMRAIQITRDQVSVVWHPGENIQARELWRKPLSNCIDVARMLLHCGIGQNAKRGGRGGGGGRLDLMIVTRLDLRQLLDLFAHWAQQLERPQQPISVVQHGGCDMGIRRRGGATLSSSSSSAATSKEVAAKSRRVIACDPVCSTDEKDGNGKGIVEDEDNDDDEQDVEWDCRHRSGNLACEVA